MPRSRAGRPAARPTGRTASAAPSPPSGTRSYSTSAQPAAPPQAQPAAQGSFAPAPSAGGGMMSGLMGTMAQGMALGTGSAIAHRGIDAAWGSMFGGGSGQAAPEPAQLQTSAQQLQQAEHPCANTAQLFADCMSKNNGDMGACDFVYNAMQQCKLANP